MTTRRKLLAGAAGTAGLVAIAGCVDDSEQQQQAVSALNDAGGNTPPQPPETAPDNEYWQYLIASQMYQNEQIQAQTQAIRALVDNAD